MSVIEIIRFTTHPGTTTEALQQALELLDRELEHIGGLQTRTLYKDADIKNGWLIDYRWRTLVEAQESMSKVATTNALTQLMALVSEPQSMSMSYGTAV